MAQTITLDEGHRPATAQIVQAMVAVGIIPGDMVSGTALLTFDHGMISTVVLTSPKMISVDTAAGRDYTAADGVIGAVV